MTGGDGTMIMYACDCKMQRGPIGPICRRCSISGGGERELSVQTTGGQTHRRDEFANTTAYRGVFVTGGAMGFWKASSAFARASTARW